MSRRALGCVALGVALLAAGGLAYSTIPSAGNVINGCYDTATGALRVIDAEGGGACRAGETALSWNQAGPPGPPGPAGPQGVQGGPGAAPPPELDELRGTGRLKLARTTRVVKKSTATTLGATKSAIAVCPSSHPKAGGGSYDLSGVTAAPSLPPYVSQSALGLPPKAWGVNAFVASSTPWKLTAIAFCTKS